MNKKRNKRSRLSKGELERESQAAIAVTVFWMLSAFATVSAEVIWGVASAATTFTETPVLQMLGHVSLFTAAVTGGCALLATPVVLRIRHQSPPRAVTWGVIGVATVAIVAAVLA